LAYNLLTKIIKIFFKEVFMKVSVIIPTLNAEKFIGNLLKNLIEVQTLKPDEIIVIDSSSQDRTVEIAKSYGCKTIIIEKEYDKEIYQEDCFGIS